MERKRAQLAAELDDKGGAAAGADSEQGGGKKKKTNKSKKAKRTKSLLSFGDEGEDEGG